MLEAYEDSAVRLEIHTDAKGFDRKVLNFDPIY